MEPASKATQLPPSTSNAEIQDVIKLIKSKRRLPFDYENLTCGESKRCLDILVQQNLDGDIDVWKDSFMSFLIYCDTDLLFEECLLNTQVHNILSKVLPLCEFNPILMAFRTILNKFLEHKEKYSNTFIPFLDFLTDKHLLLNISMYYLETIPLDDPRLTECLNFLGLYLESILALTKMDPLKLGILVSKLYFEMIKCHFTVVTTQLLLQSDNSNIRHSIIEQIVSRKIEISVFLSSLVLSDCKYLEEKLSKTIEKAVEDDSDLRDKLHSIEELAIDPTSLTLVQAIDVIVFIDDTDVSFKRIFIEHLLFGGVPFPFYTSISCISDELHSFFMKHNTELREKPYLISFIMNKESFLNSIMKVLLRIWIESGSQTKEDMESVFALIPILLEKIDLVLYEVYGNLSLEELVNIVYDFIKSIDYRKARKYQLQTMKDEQLEIWKLQMSEFDSILSDQVYDFVRHQRLVQLQKGTWVYSQNPSDLAIKAPRVYFIVVSDNQLNLLVREFETKTEEQPIVQGSNIIFPSLLNLQTNQNSETKVLSLKSIAFFESKDISSSPATNNSVKLVNLTRKNLYTRIRLLDKNNRRILKIYLDSKELKFIWLDGLRLISPANMKEKLSSETTDQLKILESVRKDVQMVNLHTRERLDSTFNPEDNDDEFYDFETLKSLPNEFYYE